MVRIRAFWAAKSIRVKLLSMLLVQLGGLSVAFGVLFCKEVMSAAKDDTVAQAMRITDMAESVRLGVARQWQQGIYSQEQLAQWGQQGEKEKILSTVPIVAAWTAAMEKSEAGNYQFRTPSAHARNEQNRPDAMEQRALDAFHEDRSRLDFVEFDHEKNQVHYFRPIHLTKDCLMCHGDPSTSQERWGNNQGLDPTGHRMENFKEGDLYGAYRITQSLEKADQRAMAAIWKGGSVVLMCVIIASLWMAWFLSRSLIQPLSACVSAFQRIGKGDLRETVDANSQDEIGQLQSGLNSMVLRLREMIQGLYHNSQNLNRVSSKLTTTAERVQEAVSNTSSRSTVVAAAAEEMSMTLQNVNISLQEVSEGVQSVAVAANQFNASTDVIVNNTNEAASVALQAAELTRNGRRKIIELEEATKGIGKIVEVIQDIAEQTNLLALNATIEASRAGEAGRGFAVVAEEVKQLAQKSAQATAEIRTRIGAVQGLSGNVVTTITDVEAIVEKVSDRTDQISNAISAQKEAIDTIAQQISQTASLTESVTIGVNETAAAASEVARNVAEVNEIAGQTSGEAVTTKAAGSEVKQASSQFEEMLSHFAV